MATLKENTTIGGEEIFKKGNIPGTIIMFAGPQIPEGYLECDGKEYIPSKYPELYEAIGKKFGNNLPDLKGLFVMGVSPGNPNFGEYRGDVLGDHTHNYVGNNTASIYRGTYASRSLSVSATSTKNTTSSGSSVENRPINIALKYIIKT